MKTVATPTEEHVVVSSAGRDRTMTVVGPGSAEDAPVILVFHGSRQTAKIVRSFSGGTFDALTTRGAVVAYLDGYKKNWNDSRLTSPTAARAENVDDVAFASAAIDRLARTHHIDRSRVFAVGFSAGGSMAIRLLHEVPDLIAGAGIIGATQAVPENFTASAATPLPRPVVLIHGTRDPLVPYDGGMASIFGFSRRGLGQSAPDTARYFARRNGITTEPTSQTLSTLGKPGDKTSIERTDYTQSGLAPVTLYTVHGGGHVIPNPKKALRIMGRSTSKLVAADAIADFFDLPQSQNRAN
jgi:polyhydroxybutyrate depolymerase